MPDDDWAGRVHLNTITLFQKGFLYPACGLLVGLRVFQGFSTILEIVLNGRILFSVLEESLVSFCSVHDKGCVRASGHGLGAISILCCFFFFKKNELVVFPWNRDEAKRSFPSIGALNKQCWLSQQRLNY